MRPERHKESSAVALIYDESTAPVVIAKGKGYLALQIIDSAREHDVPLQEQVELVEALSELNLGDEIPGELYVAVAEVLSFAFALQHKVPASWRDE